MSNNPYLDRLRALDNRSAHADTALKDHPASPGDGFEGFEGAEGSPFLKIEGQQELDVGSLHAVAPVDSFEGFEGTQSRAVSKIEGRPPGSEVGKGPSPAPLKTLKTSTAHNLDELSQDRENENVPGGTFETFETPIETSIEDDLRGALDACSSVSGDTVQNVQKVQKGPAPQAGSVMVEASEVRAHPSPTTAQRRRWADAADQIVRELGRHQRGDFSRRKWQQTLADVRRFVEGGWAHRAWRLGWGLLELFGVDRKAPWARRDRRGLALMLDGHKVIDLTEHGATIRTETGAHLTYSRKPIELLEVVLVDQIAPVYRLATIRREWAEVLERVDRCRSLDADVSETRWRQYCADLGRLADENWDYPPCFFMGWNGRGAFPVSAKRALAWVIDGGTITNLTRDTAICGNVVFRRLGGDQGWQRGVGPHLDQGRGKVANWLLD
jgi:hypothetical protein